MRNLLEYPVTRQEQLDLINAYIEAFNKAQAEELSCGDMEGVVLESIRQDLEQELFRE